MKIFHQHRKMICRTILIVALLNLAALTFLSIRTGIVDGITKWALLERIFQGTRGKSFDSQVKVAYGHTGLVAEAPPAILEPQIDGEWTPPDQLKFTKLGEQLEWKYQVKDEWDDAIRIPLTYQKDPKVVGGYAYLKYDEKYLYCMIDLTAARDARKDMTAAFVFDTRHDGYSYGTSEDNFDIIIKIEDNYFGKIYSSVFSMQNAPFIKEVVAAATFGKSPNSSENHVKYEVGIPVKTLTKYPNTVEPNRVGFRVFGIDTYANIYAYGPVPSNTLSDLLLTSTPIPDLSYKSLTGALAIGAAFYAFHKKRSRRFF